MKEKIFKTLSKYKKILEEKGYNVIYVGLYGSQNYNLQDEYSDIDVKAIILPNLHDVIFRKVTSKVIECEEGNIDVKDLLTFYDVIKKGNYSYVESIETEYSIGDKYIKQLFLKFKPNLKSFLGAMHEKRKALTHEYPSKKEEFAKWGFDPKQYHHILRLSDLLSANYTRIMNNEPLISFIKYEDDEEREFLIDVKRNLVNYNREYVEKQSDEIIEHNKMRIPENYKYEVVNIDDEINDYIEKHIKLELIKDNPVSYAREIRTFDTKIPKKDLEKFPVLKEYDGKDISYIVYESLEIL